MSKTTKNSLVLSFITIISRIFGLIRDHFQAIFFGTGPVAFAWEIATLLPGALRTLLVEGGISQAFIPIYSSCLEKSTRDAQKTAGIVISFTFGIMTLVTIIALLVSPFLLPLLTHQEKSETEFLISLNSILILYLVPASLTSILIGISNSHNFFVLPAILPIILNIGMIVGFLTSNLSNPQTQNATSQAWIWMGMSGLQFFIQYIFIWRKGHSPILSLNLKNETVHKMFALMLPAILSNAVFQINQLLDVVIASVFINPEIGAVPAMRFAQRLIQLPTGVIGVALSTAILPILSRQIAKIPTIPASDIKKNKTEIENEIIGAIEFALFLTVPATLGLFFMGEDIITLIFSGGKWDEKSTLVTWSALKYFLLGIPLYSLNKILSSVFFAHKDTRTPLQSMLVSISVNLGLNLTLVHFMQQSGIALSTSIAAFVQTVQLAYYLKKRHQAISLDALYPFFVRSIPLWIVMTIYLLLIQYFFVNPSHQIGSYIIKFLHKENLNPIDQMSYYIFPKIFLGVGGGLCLYFSHALIKKSKEMQTILGIFKK